MFTAAEAKRQHLLELERRCGLQSQSKAAVVASLATLVLYVTTAERHDVLRHEEGLGGETFVLILPEKETSPGAAIAAPSTAAGGEGGDTKQNT